MKERGKQRWIGKKDKGEGNRKKNIIVPYTSYSSKIHRLPTKNTQIIHKNTQIAHKNTQSPSICTTHQMNVQKGPGRRRKW